MVHITCPEKKLLDGWMLDSWFRCSRSNNIKRMKGGCGAASVRSWNTKIWCQKSWLGLNFPPWRVHEDDVSTTLTRVCLTDSINELLIKSCYNGSTNRNYEVLVSTLYKGIHTTNPGCLNQKEKQNRIDRLLLLFYAYSWRKTAWKLSNLHNRN